MDKSLTIEEFVETLKPGVRLGCIKKVYKVDNGLFNHTTDVFSRDDLDKIIDDLPLYFPMDKLTPEIDSIDKPDTGNGKSEMHSWRVNFDPSTDYPYVSISIPVLYKYFITYTKEEADQYNNFKSLSEVTMKKLSELDKACFISTEAPAVSGPTIVIEYPAWLKNLDSTEEHY